jgi:hypothetical protein
MTGISKEVRVTLQRGQVALDNGVAVEFLERMLSQDEQGKILNAVKKAVRRQDALLEDITFRKVMGSSWKAPLAGPVSWGWTVWRPP